MFRQEEKAIGYTMKGNRNTETGERKAIRSYSGFLITVRSKLPRRAFARSAYG